MWKNDKKLGYGSTSQAADHRRSRSDLRFMIRSHNCWSVSVYGAMYFPIFCTVEEVWMLTPMGLSENRVIILYIYHIIPSFSDRPKYDIKLLIHLIFPPPCFMVGIYVFYPLHFSWWNDIKYPWHRPRWILNGIKPQGPPEDMGSYTIVTFSEDPMYRRGA